MIILTALLLALTSCISVVPPHTTIYSLDSVQEFLEQDAYAQAWVEVGMLEQQQKLSSAEADVFRQNIKEMTRREYQEALAGKDLLRAWTLSSILQHLGTSSEETPLFLQENILHTLLEDSQHARFLTDLQRYDLVDRFSGNEHMMQLADGYHSTVFTASRDFDVSGILPALATVMVDLGTEVVRRVATREFSIGSGIFVQNDGYLLTNYHVISEMVDPEYEGYARLFVLLGSSLEERIPARVVAYDRLFDLALLKVELTREISLSFSPLDSLASGTKVFALGSPGGLSQTVTAGIISATRRDFSEIGSIVQFDASVNPGNSGGVLVEETGTVIGVVFAKGFDVEGISYAIPGYWVLHSLSRLLRTEGEVTHPWIGLTLADMEGELTVISVFPGSSADRVGIREGDILISVNDVSLSSTPAYQGLLLGLEQGMLIPSRWQRDDRQMDILLPIESRPHLPMQKLVEQQPVYEALFPIAGMQLETLRLRKRYVEGKIIQVLPGSAADIHDFSLGDIIYLLDWSVEDEYLWVKMITRKRTEGFLNKSVIISFPLFSSAIL